MCATLVPAAAELPILRNLFLFILEEAIAHVCRAPESRLAARQSTAGLMPDRIFLSWQCGNLGDVVAPRVKRRTKLCRLNGGCDPIIEPLTVCS